MAWCIHETGNAIYISAGNKTLKMNSEAEKREGEMIVIVVDEKYLKGAL